MQLGMHAPCFENWPQALRQSNSVIDITVDEIVGREGVVCEGAMVAWKLFGRPVIGGPQNGDWLDLIGVFVVFCLLQQIRQNCGWREASMSARIERCRYFQTVCGVICRQMPFTTANTLPRFPDHVNLHSNSCRVENSLDNAFIKEVTGGGGLSETQELVHSCVEVVLTTSLYWCRSWCC